MAQLQATGITGSLSLTGSALQLPLLTNAQTSSYVSSGGTWWYNTSINAINYVCGLGAWTEGGALIQARHSLGGAGSSNTAALAFAGFYNSAVACTEAYNGTSWSSGGVMIITRYANGGTGTSTAALAFGGLAPTAVTCTEAYNGSSWSSGNAMIVARSYPGGLGTQSATLSVGGFDETNNLACTEAYNGTSWSAGGALITARRRLSGTGTTTAALAIGGFSTAVLACTEAYNGTSWSAGGALSVARYNAASGLSGTQNSSVFFSGKTNSGFPAATSTCTERYNGSSWISSGAMNASRWALAGAGSTNSALAFGGLDAGNAKLTCTESYSYGLRVTTL